MRGISVRVSPAAAYFRLWPRASTTKALSKARTACDDYAAAELIKCMSALWITARSRAAATQTSPMCTHGHAVTVIVQARATDLWNERARERQRQMDSEEGWRQHRTRIKNSNQKWPGLGILHIREAHLLCGRPKSCKPLFSLTA